MKLRSILTIILALAGIGLMIFYTWCDTSCAYLKGDIFGIDLKYVGIIFMVAMLVLVFSRSFDIVRLLLAGGIGVEVHLVAFQFREDVFCPFCMAFGIIVIVLYLLNYERPRKKDQWLLNILSVFGEARLPLIGRYIPLLVVMILGYLFVVLFFNGSVMPSYSAIAPVTPTII